MFPDEHIVLKSVDTGRYSPDCESWCFIRRRFFSRACRLNVPRISHHSVSPLICDNVKITYNRARRYSDRNSFVPPTGTLSVPVVYIQSRVACIKIAQLCATIAHNRRGDVATARAFRTASPDGARDGDGSLVSFALTDTPSGNDDIDSSKRDLDVGRDVAVARGAEKTLW